MTTGVDVQRGPTARTPASAGLSRIPPAVLVIYVVWFLALFEPEWWLASVGPQAVKKIGSLMWPLVLFVALSKARARHWYWPLTLMLIVSIVPLSFAENKGKLVEVFKVLLYYYVIVVATYATITSQKRVIPLILMFLIQFGWWMIHGLPNAAGLPRVRWEAFMANDDGFAVIATMGLAFSYFLFQAARTARLRQVALVVTGLTLVGTVASMARGALLTAGVLMVVFILRSPNRVNASLRVAVILVIAFVAQGILFPGGKLWKEMSTVTEGLDEGTSKDRWDLWKAAIIVYQHYPIVGAGPGNYGPAAARTVKPGQISGWYSDPVRIYGRVTHNVYMQILSELGTLGMFAFIATVVGFLRRNIRMRRPWAIEQWDAGEGGKLFDLRRLSLALETTMIAYLGLAFFYDGIYIQWPFLLIALNLVLANLVRRPRAAGRRSAGSLGGVVRPMSVDARASGLAGMPALPA